MIFKGLLSESKTLDPFAVPISEGVLFRSFIKSCKAAQDYR